jgi:hypothetical protein
MRLVPFSGDGQLVQRLLTIRHAIAIETPQSNERHGAESLLGRKPSSLALGDDLLYGLKILCHRLHPPDLAALDRGREHNVLLRQLALARLAQERCLRPMLPPATSGIAPHGPRRLAVRASARARAD